MMLNKKILLLEGGYNEEHEVSIITAKEVKKALSNLGYNYRITDLQAALGNSQLNKLDKFVKKRIEIAKKKNINYD